MSWLLYGEAAAGADVPPFTERLVLSCNGAGLLAP